ncbi:PAS domain S-box protein [Nocardioides zeae]|uniref:Sensor-like histidine kinase SenX3 n=1 Tax=Nocardioides imazamoxiresistens TaxID=3231893 RepID=A0ABU3PXU1_9ACTN|nr:PAS domain S-box protein [Nocardioides zeae]MDT9594054.1 PAS domain S-box protein [Nocardioides zeae]
MRMMDQEHARAGRPVAPSLHAGIVAAVPDAVVVVDDAGLIVLANPHVTEVFGWAEHEICGQPVEVLMPPRFRALHPGRRGGYSGHRMDLLELRGHRKDGTEFPAEISLATIEEDGRRWVCATVRDITARKRSEERFRQLVDAAPDPLVITDAAGTIVLANQQAQAVFGYAGDDLVGQPIEILVPARHREGHRRMRAAFAAAPDVRPMGSGRELYALHRDGHEIPVEISLAPLVTDDELLLSASIRDLSERNRIQAQVDQVREDLVATVSHEMRTPLTSIIGYLELVLDDEPLPAQTSSMLEIVRQNAHRELALVNDLLTVASVGDEGPGADVVDLGALVRASVAQALPVAAGRGVRLGVSPGHGAALVRGRSHRLRQVVDNLVSNALKFTPAGGTVTVSSGDVDGRASITVTDDGVGIEADELPVVFERLYRTPSAIAACTPGAGIGLSLVKAITQAHGGRVEVTSAVGEGSTFRVLLPYAA